MKAKKPRIIVWLPVEQGYQFAQLLSNYEELANDVNITMSFESLTGTINRYNGDEKIVIISDQKDLVYSSELAGAIKRMHRESKYFVINDTGSPLSLPPFSEHVDGSIDIDKIDDRIITVIRSLLQNFHSVTPQMRLFNNKYHTA